MINNIEYAFPAGDESDENSDEWDIGFSSCTKRSDSEVSGTTLPVDDNVSALKKAISAGDVDLVQQLLDGGLWFEIFHTFLSGVDAETRLGFDWTPLMCAVHVAHHDLAELLLDHGANANFSRDHYTVLMAACTANSANEEKIAKCVALLLSRNADPNAYNRWPCTLKFNVQVMWACDEPSHEPLNANFGQASRSAAHHLLPKLCTTRSVNNFVALLTGKKVIVSCPDKIFKERSHITSLMLAARDGYCKVINLLVSHRAELNTQDESGHTALMVAVQYGQERAVLKLLQLGADRSIKTKAGKTAADLAKELKQPQVCDLLPLALLHLIYHMGHKLELLIIRISRILDSSGGSTFNDGVPSKTETEFTFLNQKPEPPCVSEESSAKLCDIELLLHGLNLEYLSDIMKENDITWSYLLTMEKEDLEKIGITNSKDQKKLLKAIQEMHLDKVDLDTMMQLNNIDNGSEELYNFLISLRQQCCYLTEMVQDVIRRFPRSPSELVLTWDPNKEAQSICAELVVQTRDLQKEVICLKDLLSKVSDTQGSEHCSSELATRLRPGADRQKALQLITQEERGMLGGWGWGGGCRQPALRVSLESDNKRGPCGQAGSMPRGDVRRCGLSYLLILHCKTMEEL
ncbi:hypothetical protein P4O66_018336 [Electrophorus voltai]|uniref:Ankyrin repeat, SAM and basic leucine zipper domain-containing protein 1 n=1 Tax=Electrophorus voltai TaxID=2609070 RepID=A0AAD8YRU1_9TELE|nr:hypothetical protein P4O66_018336 [Electrophorus voltai]